MNKKLSELDDLGHELEDVFEQLEELAMAEDGGDDAAELWLRARFRSAIAFDEHLRLLRDAADTNGDTADTTAGSTVKALRKLAGSGQKSERLSTFTKVERGEDVHALTAIHAGLTDKSAARNNRKGKGESS